MLPTGSSVYAKGAGLARICCVPGDCGSGGTGCGGSGSSDALV